MARGGRTPPGAGRGRGRPLPGLVVGVMAVLLALGLLLPVTAASPSTPSTPNTTPPSQPQQGQQQGNCISEHIHFHPSRIYNAQGGTPGNVDPGKFDFILDYGEANLATVEEGQGGGILLSLTRSPTGGPGQGIRLTSVRSYLHARMSLRLQAPDSPGIVTSFITMSERRDEIDWEILQGQAETNVFYRGIPEYGVHGSSHALDTSSGPHTYGLDWRRDRLDFFINGARVQSQMATEVSPMTPPGESWYPATPSKIQLAIWDAGASEQKGVREW
jgi:hypothetical protein